MSPKYSLRAARATDLPIIYIGELDYIRQIEPEHEARWKDALRWHLTQWTAAIDRMIIAEIGSDTAGYCFWEVHGEAAVLASIYVLPERRRTGLGKRLLDRFITDAHAEGFGNLTLGVKEDNPARLLYESAGFVYTHDDGEYRHYRYPLVPRTSQPA
jgi:[ribosomal protein S18]-alanine N-acetyltransferase